MYSNGYPRTTFALQPKKSIHKSKGKSCGYYLRIVFFFSSLIQTLIIVSLVLFLVYGQPEKSAEEKHVDELSENFKRVSLSNLELRKDKADLGATLTNTNKEKVALLKDVDKLKTDLNASKNTSETEKLKLSRCIMDKRRIEMTRSTPINCPTPAVRDPLSGVAEKHHSRLIELVERNYTLKVQELQRDLDSAKTARDQYQIGGSEARRENEELKERLKQYTQTCKEDFSKPLEGIQEVTAAFLAKINNVFPHSLTFHLTCEKQQEQLNGIRTNCTNLSRQVEDKFQSYLNRVGDQVAVLQGSRSELQVENQRLVGVLQTTKNELADLKEKTSRQNTDAANKYDRDIQEQLKEKTRLRMETEIMKIHLEKCELLRSVMPPKLPPAPPKPFMPVGSPMIPPAQG
ncbi:plasmalemma vesicle associated protein b [Sardina pilchardus]|uniref:plasmalemma vesicle associated protein b n=1 Tax=Sardina pilchardus TaxID=27697 RepID=UPI002E10D7D0